VERAIRVTSGDDAAKAVVGVGDGLATPVLPASAIAVGIVRPAFGEIGGVDDG